MRRGCLTNTLTATRDSVFGLGMTLTAPVWRADHTLTLGLTHREQCRTDCQTKVLFSPCGKRGQLWHAARQVWYAGCQFWHALHSFMLCRVYYQPNVNVFRYNKWLLNFVSKKCYLWESAGEWSAMQQMKYKIVRIHIATYLYNCPLFCMIMC